ncbi:hypothetical protein MYE70_10435 [Marinobacter alexandrii]|uniref:hypothetical protein n=1 Tax=Marinobacter alexandrii TaxID=2570351 RepID=UPI001FFF1BA6|nr:hypothetical protein [Marinobacter alexandrii]MCK2149483.1 hypothetical protein [Marinobacter alexandrii]
MSTHTHSSQLFRSQAAQLPQHKMHLLGRLVVTMYLAARYKRAWAHSALIARALEHMDQQLWLAASKETA